MALRYSKKALERFLHPKYMGKMRNPDGTGKAGNPICGDILEVSVKIGGKEKKKVEYIQEISFRTLGCCAAIAVSDVICELAKGQTIEAALRIKSDKIVKSLGGLPGVKYHCSLLGVDALTEAIYNYLSKNKKPIPEKLKEKHQRIERQRKEIEKRYKEWIR